jgi:hypothetical protein
MACGGIKMCEARLRHTFRQGEMSKPIPKGFFGFIEALLDRSSNYRRKHRSPLFMAFSLFQELPMSVWVVMLSV